jgi:curved DNA-binding protein
MEYKDYYKILGVPKTASQKEIKAAYRKLARKHHPDLNQGNKQAEARIKEINEAYEVLSHPEKRKKYEQMGEHWSDYANVAGAGGGWPAGSRVRVNVGGYGGQATEFSDFSDFFQTFFGGGGGGDAGGFGQVFGRAARAKMPGADLEAEVELTLEEVLQGTTRSLRLTEGSSRQVEVKIPAGVRDSSRIRVAGEGAPGSAGAPKGDLYLRVRIRPHPAFERKGDDLHTTITVRVTTAVLGGEVEVPTLEGPKGIKIPAGTPVGRVFRLRGLGLPRLETGGGRGDLMAALSVEIPTGLSERERELFEELKRLGR